MTLDDFYVAPNAMENSRVMTSFLTALHSGDLDKLVKSGTIKDYSDAYALLCNSSEALFRTSSETNVNHAIWIAKAKQKAITILLNEKIRPYNHEDLPQEFLRTTATKSFTNSNISTIRESLISKGIIFLYEPYIKGSKIDGAVFKLPSGNPCIAISGRFQRTDSVWFTALHELAHVILHYDNLDQPIIDDLLELSSDRIERQANSAARAAIAPASAWRTLSSKVKPSESNLIEDSKILSVHPALLAGIIRFERNDYTIFSKQINNRTDNATILKDME